MALRRKTLKNTVVSLTVAGIIASTSIQAHGALGDRVLTRGTRHNDVQELQQHLKDLGYFTYHSTTTYYGDITYQAVRNFQRAQNISVDGSFGPESYRTLQRVLAGSSGSSNSNSSGQLVYTRALRLGLSGRDVNDLQEALKSLGYLVINNTTNYFGTMTRQAVMDFQRANGLAVDGSFGPASHRKMNQILSGSSGSSNPGKGDENRKALTTKIIATAKQYIGVPYVFGGSTPSAFDCSGYTQFVYRQYGIHIPRTSIDQSRVGTQISRSNLQAGDLIIFSNTYRPGPSHTGIYLGNDQFIHASSSSGVTISNLNSSYYRSHFSYGRRIY